MPAGTGRKRQVITSRTNVELHHVIPILMAGPLVPSPGLNRTRL